MIVSSVFSVAYAGSSDFSNRGTYVNPFSGTIATSTRTGTVNYATLSVTSTDPSTKVCYWVDGMINGTYRTATLKYAHIIGNETGRTMDYSGFSPLKGSSMTLQCSTEVFTLTPPAVSGNINFN